MAGLTILLIMFIGFSVGGWYIEYQEKQEQEYREWQRYREQRHRAKERE